jgi:hypothetical protein
MYSGSEARRQSLQYFGSDGGNDDDEAEAVVLCVGRMKLTFNLS